MLSVIDIQSASKKPFQISNFEVNQVERIGHRNLHARKAFNRLIISVHTRRRHHRMQVCLNRCGIAEGAKKLAFRVRLGTPQTQSLLLPSGVAFRSKLAFHNV